ncbi:substrate-binding domain-containing protein [candidate division KSB1 bacterium]|nr:substrate-binding domain-containing protein [candidate division KSB1 bacterium]
MKRHRLQITLNDIAKELNVSVVTVSKALRDHPDISERTKQRIKKFANELGYTPNFSARNLSSRRSNTIGLIVPKIGNFFFPSLIKSIYKAANFQNYDVILMISYDDAENENRHLKTLLSMRVDGLLVAISEKTTDIQIYETIKKTGIPLVFFDRVIEGPEFSYVKIDDRQGACLAVEHAINTGYKRIAHLAGFKEINIGRDRCAGFVDAMKKHNLPVPENWIIEGSLNEEAGYNGFMKLCQNKNLPEIILTVTFSVAIGVFQAAIDLGLKIPEDIDVICIGEGPINPFASPSLSCVYQPIDEMGTKVVEVLIRQIQNLAAVPEQIILPPKLKVRETFVRQDEMAFPKR